MAARCIFVDPARQAELVNRVLALSQRKVRRNGLAEELNFGRLKLTKTDNGRRLFEIRGSKIVTRLSLVVENDIAPWGDGRLLIHGNGGEVRYVVDLYQPRAKPAPR